MNTDATGSHTKFTQRPKTHRDAYPSPLNYYRFPKSVCTSVNEVGPWAGWVGWLVDVWCLWW